MIILLLLLAFLFWSSLVFWKDVASKININKQLVSDKKN